MVPSLNLNWIPPGKRAYRIGVRDQVENRGPIFLSWLFHSSDCGIL